MTLQETYFVSEIVVGVAVIVSIVFVALELRQNSYLLRKSMADQRLARVHWLTETLATNNEFREFHTRIPTDYEDFNEDEKYRANSLGLRVIRNLLDELVAYFDGQISDNEWLSLKWNMEFAARRSNVQAAYEFVKGGYPKRVTDYWEALSAEGKGHVNPHL